MTSDTQTSVPVKVFISYSHKDEKLKQQLVSHLNLMVRQGAIESWDDQHIKAGSEWNSLTLQQLNAANVVLCLLSANFVSSDSCYLIQSQQALEQHEAGKVVVIPILLKAIDLRRTIFRHLLAIPRSGKALADHHHDRERALSKVAEEIAKVVDVLYK